MTAEHCCIHRLYLTVSVYIWYTLLNKLIPILEISTNKRDGKRSLCFTPSPNSKRPADKRPKSLNYDESIC